MRRPRVAVAGTALVAAGYLLLAALAIGPTARIEHHRRWNVTRDGDAIRRDPLSFLRYYGSFQGVPYICFESGMRMTGQPLPPLDSPLGALLATARDATITSTRPLLPYRDFPSVYPPLANLSFAALAFFTRTFDGFFLALRVLNLVAVVATAAVLYLTVRTCMEIDLARYVLATILIVSAFGPRWLCLFDTFPAFFVGLLLYSCVRQRWLLAGAALAAATLLKVYPVFLVPTVLVWAHGSGRFKAVGRFIAGGAVAGGLILAPWLLSAPVTVLDGVLTQAGRTYLDSFSFAGSLIVTLRALGLASFHYGGELETEVIVSPASAAVARVSLTLMALAVAAVFLAFLFRDRAVAGSSNEPAAVRLARPFLAIHLAVLLTGSVFSPHYVMWLLPVLLPFVAWDRTVLVAGAILGVSIQVQFPMLQGFPPGTREPLLIAVFAVRNAALIALLWLAWRSRWPPGPSKAAAPLEAFA